MAYRLLASELVQKLGEPVYMAGWVHRMRDLGGVRFLALRDRSGLAQAVLPKALDVSGVDCEAVVHVRGKPRLEARAPNGCELVATDLEVVSAAISNLFPYVNDSTVNDSCIQPPKMQLAASGLRSSPWKTRR